MVHRRTTRWLRGSINYKLFALVSACCLIICFKGYDVISNDLDNRDWKNSSRKCANESTGPYSKKYSVKNPEISGGFSNYTEVGDGHFYILSAIAEYSPQSHTNWPSIVVNGWEMREELPIKYKCCFKYPDGSFKSTYLAQRRVWRTGVPLVAVQLICNINNITRPEVISLVLPEQSCFNGNYTTPLYRTPFTEPKFAICAKIVYGQKNPVELVEWMEYHLLFGIGKVVIYPYEDLNEKAWDVLKHYAKTGILEIVPLPYVPKLDKFNRTFSEGDLFRPYKEIMWHDEQVVDYDAQERLKQYKYYTLIDTDELITPKGNEQRSYVQLMELLLSKKRNTASFTMYSEMHLLDWAKTNNNSKLVMGQYGRHTKPMIGKEPKLLHVTGRQKPGSVWIHTSEAAAGFVKSNADPSIVVLKHFRYCKMYWVKQKNKTCHIQFEMVTDTLLENSLERLEQKVLNVKRLLNLK